ncbi:MAG TPA: hypothetical protein ENI20_06530 [Bacteroides sp.]|nr:hypothetical protein [Bacteroides sp.]
MKKNVKRGITVLLALTISAWAFSQQKINNVEFEGDKTEILKSSSTSYGKGTLSSGEAITNECLKGTCYMTIDYKGRKIQTPIGETITNLTIFEFDFAGDEDNELVIVNDFKGTSVLYVFAYARGIIQKLYQKEVFNNRTVIKTNYIEMYSPGGLDTVWNYYQGIFWSMTAEDF